MTSPQSFLFEWVKSIHHPLMKLKHKRENYDSLSFLFNLVSFSSNDLYEFLLKFFTFEHRWKFMGWEHHVLSVKIISKKLSQDRSRSNSCREKEGKSSELCFQEAAEKVMNILWEMMKRCKYLHIQKLKHPQRRILLLPPIRPSKKCFQLVNRKRKFLNNAA